MSVEVKTASPNSERSIGEIVANNHRAADVFKKYGVDFCCGGKENLSDTCIEKGLSLDEVEEALAVIEDKRPEQNFNHWELDFLVDYIVNVHHKYILEAIPLLTQYCNKVTEVHGKSHPELLEIQYHFREIAQELLMHMQKEEQILFPYIRKMVEVKNTGEVLDFPSFGTIRNPLQMMESEHENSGTTLHSINKLTNGFQPPEGACMTYKVFYSKLEEFENDMHQHIHLENNILFPKAAVLEQVVLN